MEKTHSNSAGNDCFDICLFVLAAYVIGEASLSDYPELVSLCNGMLEEITSGIKTMRPQIHQKKQKQKQQGISFSIHTTKKEQIAGTLSLRNRWRDRWKMISHQRHGRVFLYRHPSLHLLVTCFTAADQTLPVFPLTCCQTTKWVSISYLIEAPKTDAGEIPSASVKVAFVTPDRMITLYSTAVVGGFNRAAQSSSIICTLQRLFFCLQKLSMVRKERIFECEVRRLK